MGLGVPGKRPYHQLKLALQKKKIPQSLFDAGKKLIEERNMLVHNGPSRAGLQNRDEYIALFLDVKVALLRIAQWVPPEAGQSWQHKLDEEMVALQAERLLVRMEAELSPSECCELGLHLMALVRQHQEMDSMQPLNASARRAAAWSSRLAEFERATGMQASDLQKRWGPA